MAARLPHDVSGADRFQAFPLSLFGAERETQEKSDPWSPPTGGERVLRGGSFRNKAEVARAASRAGYYAWVHEPSVGLRVVVPPHARGRIVNS